MNKKLKIFITLFLILSVFPVMAADKKNQCETKHGRWDGVTCWCGVKKQSLEDSAELCTKEDEKAKNNAEKAYLEDVEHIKQQPIKLLLNAKQMVVL